MGKKSSNEVRKLSQKHANCLEWLDSDEVAFDDLVKCRIEVRLTSLTSQTAELFPGEPTEPHSVLVSSFPFLLGRSDTCQIRFSSRQVSNFHCALCLKGRHVIVQDLESTNGTCVNQLCIERPTELHDSDILKIGGSSFWVTIRKGGHSTGKRTMSMLDYGLDARLVHPPAG